MRFFAAPLTLSLLTASALAAVTPLIPIQKSQGDTSGRHIVTLKNGVSQDTVLNALKITADSLAYKWSIINGFAGSFDSNTLNALRSNPNVESITEDGIMKIVGQQMDATWGLGRTSSLQKLTDQDPSHLTFDYIYSDETLGSGVDIYIVDTGVRITHNTFGGKGGRATWGASFDKDISLPVDFTTPLDVPPPTIHVPDVLMQDDNGHGTHCAGIAAGNQYGVAKKANIIAVKVLTGAGTGSTSNIISGLNWVKDNVKKTGRPSVISMSLGGGGNEALDNAVTALTGDGIHVTVAAGNDNTDAKDTSPARTPSAVTVGASTISDTAASFSNYGSIVDIYAPGQDVISSYNTDDNASKSLSGTSMATPHVAGLIAYFAATDNLAPAAMEAKLKNMCLKDKLSAVPSGTINCLAHNS
ncbi:serine protease [Crepidotus variabilis]|uniref:Serine protease n=1 Tax=Crepidotus variabilis TaxID=179855 RepID=A0A9P6JIC5_9AGAR|nr:serine protease [Crepidotus variabilis]